MIETLYDLYLQHPIITTDSRNCPKDSIFFALKGEKFDGNKYAQVALDNGCAFAIVDDKEIATTDMRMFLVDDVLSALQQLAHHHRIALGIPVLGITGTNGKTTTKELIAAVLSKKYNVLYTQGNLNNHIGVPLTLLNLTKEHQLAVIEMGANHPGEIKTLVEIAVPNVGIITNVGKAHLEGFGSFEGVIRTKSELYDFLRETGGQAFVNLDNEILVEKSEGIPVIGYGMKNKTGEVWGEVTKNAPFIELNWQRRGETTIHQIASNLIGIYNAENMLAAICIGLFFGVNENAISQAISEYKPQNNRSQLTETAHNKLIIDAYNANPTSMKAALENFADISLPNKMVVLGNMGELGADSAEEHQHIVDLLSTQDLEKVFLIGDGFVSTKNNFTVFGKTDDFIEYLKNNPIENATILIKGSRTNRLETVIPYL
jgi:UDP-N-acetylmuramoyl-tripeptide--D-alanyl-D-alanine ligase